jgi:hypothetical protein
MAPLNRPRYAPRLQRPGELREDFNAFVSVWGKEYAEALEQVSSKRSE